MEDLGSFQQAAREGWLTVPVDHSHWRLDLAQICLIYSQILQPWAMQQEAVKSLSNATQWVHPSSGWKVNYAANYGNVSLNLLQTYPAVLVTSNLSGLCWCVQPEVDGPFSLQLLLVSVGNFQCGSTQLQPESAKITENGCGNAGCTKIDSQNKDRRSVF